MGGRRRNALFFNGAVECLEPKVMLSSSPSNSGEDTYSQQDSASNNEVVFVARGEQGDEEVALRVRGDVVDRFSLSTDFKGYRYISTNDFNAEDVQLSFENDKFEPEQGIDRNVVLEGLKFKGKNGRTTEVGGESDEIFSTGTWDADGLQDGYGRGNTLHSGGYFAFGRAAGDEPTSDRETSTPSGQQQVAFTARGTQGGEEVALKVKGETVQRYTLGTTDNSYRFQSDQIFKVDDIQLSFENDAFEASTGVDWNVVLNNLSFKDSSGRTVVFDGNSGDIFSTGTWNADGLQDGYGRGNTLHSKGYFGFRSPSAGQQTSQPQTPQADSNSQSNNPLEGAALSLNDQLDQVFETDGSEFVARTAGDGSDRSPKVLLAKRPILKSEQGGSKKILDGLSRANVSSENLTQSIQNSPPADSAPGRFYGNSIARTEAVQKTVQVLEARPDSFVLEEDETLISNSEQLNNARERIRESGGKFLFQPGNEPLNVDSPIEVGADSTIRVDGGLNWNGSDFSAGEPDPFGSVNEGIETGIFTVKGSNVSITGSKNAALIAGASTNDEMSLSNPNGVQINNADNVTVAGLKIQNALNGIQAVGSSNVAVKGNYVADSVKRGIWTKTSDNTKIENNLMDNSGLDGVDIDAFSNFIIVKENVSVGLKGTGGKVSGRYHFWNEVGSSDNNFQGNVVIHGVGQTVLGNRAGGIQENGSAATVLATRNNKYIDNHVFYASPGMSFSGLSINGNRKIDRPSIETTNNFVWLNHRNLNNNFLQDPKPSLGDVRFLTP